ncbi:MAG: haloacid dehalogenase-like hydrolase [Anaerolineae bacterium]
MKLVLFDIDQTLLTPDGAGAAAMLNTLRDFYGIGEIPPGYHMAGKIDTQIVVELLQYAGMDVDEAQARLPEYWALYAVELERILPQHQMRALDGAHHLLDALEGRTDVVIGLLTGNLDATAAIKLRAVGLDPARFRVAAYGNEAQARTDLPPIAVARAEALTGRTFRGKDIVIIGDTPLDIACGESLGVRTIGVATGRYTVEELRAAGADAVFATLGDTRAVVAAILA